jgi:hypothetical protein
MEIRINDLNYLKFRETPWDTRAFGFNTNEVLDIVYSDTGMLQSLLIQFDDWNSAHKIRFTYTRIESENKELRCILPKAGFYYAETIFQLTKNDVYKENFAALFKNDLCLSVPEGDDYEQIRLISKNDFNYSRFHEDLNIDLDKARLRYYNWIDDLMNQGKKFIMYKKENEVISFLAYCVENEIVDMILAGSAANKGFVSFSFWATFMTYFQKQGIKRAKTVISASNLGIVNLYSRLNFKFEKTMLGFHKFYNL